DRQDLLSTGRDDQLVLEEALAPVQPRPRVEHVEREHVHAQRLRVAPLTAGRAPVAGLGGRPGGGGAQHAPATSGGGRRTGRSTPRGHRGGTVARAATVAPPRRGDALRWRARVTTPRQGFCPSRSSQATRWGPPGAESSSSA